MATILTACAIRNAVNRARIFRLPLIQPHQETVWMLLTKDSLNRVSTLSNLTILFHLMFTVTWIQMEVDGQSFREDKMGVWTFTEGGTIMPMDWETSDRSIGLVWTS